MLNLIEPEIAPFDPLTAKTRPERNMKWFGWQVVEIWPFEIRHIMMGAFETTIFQASDVQGRSYIGGGSKNRNSRNPRNPPIALSLNVQPQFAIECLRRSIRQVVGHFWSKFKGVPFGVYPWCWGPQRASDVQGRSYIDVQPWNYFWRFPTYVTTITQRHGRTDDFAV